MIDMPINIRAAGSSDAEAIASVHVASWRKTYSAMLPTEMLSELSMSERSARWARLLGGFAQDSEDRAFLAQTAGNVVGFVAVGPQRSEDLCRDGFSGEFKAIYVLEAVQRKGVGQALLRRGANHLVWHGHAAAALWVLKANAKARRFYEALGARSVGERKDVRPNATLEEVAFGLRRLADLSGR